MEQNNLESLNRLMQRNEDCLGGWAYRVTNAELQQINKIPTPRRFNKEALQSLFFPKKGDKESFFPTMPDEAFDRPE